MSPRPRLSTLVSKPLSTPAKRLAQRRCTAPPEIQSPRLCLHHRHASGFQFPAWVDAASRFTQIHPDSPTVADTKRKCTSHAPMTPATPCTSFPLFQVAACNFRSNTPFDTADWRRSILLQSFAVVHFSSQSIARSADSSLACILNSSRLHFLTQRWARLSWASGDALVALAPKCRFTRTNTLL